MYILTLNSFLIIFIFLNYIYYCIIYIFNYVYYM